MDPQHVKLEVGGMMEIKLVNVVGGKFNISLYVKSHRSYANVNFSGTIGTVIRGRTPHPSP